MLVRTQVLFKEEQRKIAEELAILQGISLSEVHRRIFDDGVKIQVKYKIKTKKKKISGAEFMLQQAGKAVAGPGDSEYDKYAYDL